ncbi:MAG TPA: DUF2442 domain-containing protein [Burkholderiaceae bacterium]|nr:DUF2442 domain-containing protein [Burkholderiaceae bacterium]
MLLQQLRKLRSLLRVVFSDGMARDIDLSDALDGEVFEQLRDVELFSQARFDPELRTVVWPNGADLAPECETCVISETRF